MCVTLAASRLRYTGIVMGTRFPAPEGARLRVLTVSGKVTVTGEDRSDIEIEPDDRHLETVDEGRVVEARARSKNLSIRVPAGMNVSVGTISGDIRIEGLVGSTKVSNVSGKVEIDRTTGDVDIRSISGSIAVADCGGCCNANTKSGRIELGHVAGAVRAHTMSGGIEVGTAGADEVNLKTISGRVDVYVDPGRSPRIRLRSLSGRTRCDCQQGSDFEIKASSISGSIEVQER
jgi:DUF4097 and DUF4098 domain-containing protein YvlB